MNKRMRALVVVLAACTTALPACSSKDNGVDLGLRKVTLDLTFKAKGEAPTLGQVIAAQEPFAPMTQAIGDVLAPSVAPRGLSFLECPSAPAGLLPEVPVQGTVTRPPDAGTYVQRVSGTYDLTGPLALKGQFLPIGAMEIANVTDVDGVDELGQQKRTIAYDVVERNALSTTTTHYESITRDISRTEVRNSPQAIASELELIWSKTTVGGVTSEFRPTPPITLMQYGGEGAEWTSAGIDPRTNTAMVVQGSITKREAIDVCGKMVDTFRVESTEQVANPLSGYSSETNSETGNVYNVATQLGGLMVRKTVDTTATFNVNGRPASLVVKSTSTVNSTTPMKRSV